MVRDALQRVASVRVVNRFLVTTALEETWPDDEPVLFLGEWCRLFGRTQRWTHLDAKVLPYHWDDRAKMYADYQYLQEFNERLLTVLTEQLNGIHGVDHGKRYWRILIGPWLGYFIQMLFDRWTSIQEAVSQYELSGTHVLTGREETFVPNDMAEFPQHFGRDEWNHHIYAAILRQFTTVPCVERLRTNSGGERATEVMPPDSWKRRIKRTSSFWYTAVTRPLNRDSDAFFLTTRLPFRDEMNLYWRLGQLPQFWRSESPVRVACDNGRRQWITAGEDRSKFEACARALIPRQMPTVYLEGYCGLVEQIAGLPWPKRPKVIWSSNAFIGDDVFKAWTGDKVERGAPLVIGQHGGHYGMGLWSFFEDHETTISDRYLSWGWTDANQPKVKPVGMLKSKSPLGVRHSEQPDMLLVVGTNSRQSYPMFSSTVASQWLDYFDDQCTFVDHLPPLLQRAVLVRLYRRDYGWEQAARWRAHFPGLRLDDGHCAIDHLIRRSRLYICTYNATTYLESFTMDVPTVIFWNPNHWELRDAALAHFQELKRVGIFHENPLSAASHVASIWADVDAWWTRPDVRNVVTRFKKTYANTPSNLPERLEGALREVMTGVDTPVVPGPAQNPFSPSRFGETRQSSPPLQDEFVRHE